MTSKLQTAVVLFDIDKTLFDTPSFFWKKVIPILKKKLDLSSDDFSQLDKKYRASLEKYTDIDPINYVKALAQEKYSPELLAETIFNQELIEESVFDDVAHTLQTLAKNFKLGIFSEAVEYFQQKKLDETNLVTFFDPNLLFIWRRKTDPNYLAKLPKNAVVVDDNRGVIQELISYQSLQPIWLNRTHQPSSNISCPIIHSLSELPEILTPVER